MENNISKMPGSNDLSVIYATKGQNLLSNFTFLCLVLMKKKVIFQSQLKLETFNLNHRELLAGSPFQNDKDLGQKQDTCRMFHSYQFERVNQENCLIVFSHFQLPTFSYFLKVDSSNTLLLYLYYATFLASLKSAVYPKQL